MYTFDVNGMGCGSCVKKITQAIKNQDAKAEVVVNLANKLVTVDSAESAAAILTTIQKLGFEATVRS